MAIDARIPLAGNVQQVDMRPGINALLAVDQNKRAEQMQPMQNRLLSAQASNQEMAMDENRRQKFREAGEFAFESFQALKELPPEQRDAAAVALVDLSKQMFGDVVGDAKPFPTDDASIDAGLAKFSMFAPQDSGNEMFAPMSAVDDQGRPVIVQGSRRGGLQEIGGYRPYAPTLSEKTAAEIEAAAAKAGISVDEYVRKQNIKAETEPSIAENTEMAKKTASESAKNAAEAERQADQWETNKGFIIDNTPGMKEILEQAPGSSLSSALQKGLSKAIGNTSGVDAQARIQQYGAMILQGMPYAPGGQSDAEMRSRANILSTQLEDPDISPSTKIDLIANFVKWQDSKASKQRANAESLRGRRIAGESKEQKQAAPSVDPALLEFMTPEERALFK